ncbi:MAG TPA: hypothetical protein VD835_14665 [Pyrinomonadaceae bacterium]|nr:hypothetical protein [Pyrinomonadaceae bacterium]
MREQEKVSEAEQESGAKGIFVGDGSTPNYPALLLFLAGGVLGGLAVHNSVNRGGGYVLYLTAALLCAFVSFALIARSGSKK